MKDRMMGERLCVQKREREREREIQSNASVKVRYLKNIKND